MPPLWMARSRKSCAEVRTIRKLAVGQRKQLYAIIGRTLDGLIKRRAERIEEELQKLIAERSIHGA